MATRSRPNISVPVNPPEELQIHPLGQENVIQFSKDSSFVKTKHKKVPFAWIPHSRAFPTLDAIICTAEQIIMIQVTISSKHSMIPDGLD
jgi:hypothetical protein